MKFKSDPGRVLTDSKTHRVIGVFDKNGIFETEDPYYVERLKLIFPEGEGKKSTEEKNGVRKPAKEKKVKP